MKIDITSHDLKVNSEHKDYLLNKIESLGRYGAKMKDSSTAVKVELKKVTNRTEGRHVECQVTMSVPRAILRAQVHANQVAEAIDLVTAKLKKQVERYTSKSNRRDNEGRWIPSSTLSQIPELLDEEFKIESLITKRKRYSNTEPMYEEEAIEQMELIGHSCFIFENLDTKRFSMVYKKDDGTYGIVEPKCKDDLNLN